MWRRFGIQAALWAGLEESRGDIIITMDADGQHPPELISELLLHHQNGHVLVLTKRNQKFRWKIAVFYKLMYLFSLYPPVESHSDFRLMDRAVIKTLLKQFKETRPFLRVLMGYWGNVPVLTFSVKARIGGTSSFNSLRSYNYLIDVLLAAGHFPFRFIFPLLFVPLIIIGSVFLLDGMLFEATVLLWLGFIGFVLGLIGLHVETLISHTRVRPPYLIREKLNVE